MELIRNETNGMVGMKWCQALFIVVMVLFVQMLVLIGLTFEMVVVVAMNVLVFCIKVVLVVCKWEATIKRLSSTFYDIYYRIG